MFRRFTRNRTGRGYGRRSYGASFGTIVLLVCLAVILGMYLTGNLAL
jgi:hypothetical protein